MTVLFSEKFERRCTKLKKKDFQLKIQFLNYITLILRGNGSKITITLLLKYNYSFRPLLYKSAQERPEHKLTQAQAWPSELFCTKIIFTPVIIIFRTERVTNPKMFEISPFPKHTTVSLSLSLPGIYDRIQCSATRFAFCLHHAVGLAPPAWPGGPSPWGPV